MHELRVDVGRHCALSSEIRRQRCATLDAPLSPSSQCSTCGSSTYCHADTGTPSSLDLADNYWPEMHSTCVLFAVSSGRTITVRQAARQEETSDRYPWLGTSLASPRRLRNGTIDLVRFDRSEAETREVYVPRRLSADIAIPPAPLPISTSPVSCPVKEQDDLQFRTDIQRLKRMSGRWTLDASRSDSFATMCELLEFDKSLLEELNKSLIIDIHVEDQMLHQHEQLPDLAEMDEVFDLTGRQVILKRRDMRHGSLFAKTFLTPVGYINKLYWPEPCAGGLVETFEFLDNEQELTVRMYVYRTDGRSCNLTLHWRRAV